MDPMLILLIVVVSVIALSVAFLFVAFCWATIHDIIDEVRGRKDD